MKPKSSIPQWKPPEPPKTPPRPKPWRPMNFNLRWDDDPGDRFCYALVGATNVDSNKETFYILRSQIRQVVSAKYCTVHVLNSILHGDGFDLGQHFFSGSLRWHSLCVTEVKGVIPQDLVSLGPTVIYEVKKSIRTESVYPDMAQFIGSLRMVFFQEGLADFTQGVMSLGENSEFARLLNNLAEVVTRGGGSD